ncbi:hypothetical protein DEJ31_07320 [Curtobacterium sp. MCPF17_031]|nr:hypothetical protein DEJ31_07320 [Curtobacterium sp. MCPF17_031]
MPADYQAVPEPAWEDLSDSMRAVLPKGVDRALARFRDRQTDAIFNDAWLEGISYTEPEIVEVIGGTHVPGHTEGEEYQVRDLLKAVTFLVNRVREGKLEPTQSLSDDLHMFIASHLDVRSVAFRGDQKERYDGPSVKLGRGERFRALDARLTHDALQAGLARIQTIEHPVVRAATWAAFAAYQQFYFDGNKRTGRYTMNAVIMSHGYDAILVPASMKASYEDMIVDALRTGDLTAHVRFLLDLYDDSGKEKSTRP